MKFVLDENNSEERVALRLVNDLNYDGTVLLVATDSDGKDWTLMMFKKGRYDLIASVPSYIGLDVDANGRIKRL